MLALWPEDSRLVFDAAHTPIQPHTVRAMEPAQQPKHMVAIDPGMASILTVVNLKDPFQKSWQFNPREFRASALYNETKRLRGAGSQFYDVTLQPYREAMKDVSNKTTSPRA